MKRFIKKFKIPIIVILGIFAVALLILGFGLIWMNQTWKHLSLDELIYTLSTPKDGVDTAMIKSFILTVLIPVLSIAIIFGILLHRFKQDKKIKTALTFVALVVPLILSASISIYTARKLDVFAYVKNKEDNKDFIDHNYVDPKDVNITFPQKKRNLIYIVVESLEAADADVANGGAFKDNYIPKLTSLAKNSETFSGTSQKDINGFHVLPAGTWTVAGIFSQTAGVPLQIAVNQNDMEYQNSFFPGLTTMGDVLADAGYNQAFLLGSKASFAGRDTYFSEHGDFDIWDYNYAKKEGWIPSDYGVFWGYEDEKLFDFAKTQLKELSSDSEPFNLTMLTVDTHFEDGYTCRLCKDDFKNNPYGNVYRCVDRQLTSFVEWAKTQDFYENTTIVIAGDHCTMDSDFFDNATVDLDQYERKGFYTVINSPLTYNQEEKREILAYDLFPTTLAALGADIEGDRLALGTNLYSDRENLVGMFGLDAVTAGVSGSSTMLKELSNIKTVTTENGSSVVFPNPIQIQSNKPASK
ncbi:MAG TPA: LTA synthase family protein [Candidatus Dorea intestinavium]|nr:LTA synthase family protein [Candidatus Dorea intestinavium]